MEAYKTALLHATVRTFEQLCFMHAEEVDQEEVGRSESTFSEGASGYAASVRFSGPLVGEVVVRLPDAVLREAATNMVGEFPDADGPPLDVLREIANVICGQTLTFLSGTGVVFKLEPPRASAELAALEKGDAAILVDIGGAAASVGIRCELADPRTVSS